MTYGTYYLGSISCITTSQMHEMSRESKQCQRHKQLEMRGKA